MELGFNTFTGELEMNNPFKCDRFTEAAWESYSSRQRIDNECLHNTRKGLTWVRMITESRLFGLWKYTMIEKQCNSCGVSFFADTKGRRLK